LAKTLIEKYPDKFTNSFEKNKEKVDKIVILESKKVRNKVAGCLVHEIRKREMPKPEFRPQSEDKRRRRWKRKRR